MKINFRLEFLDEITGKRKLETYYSDEWKPLPEVYNKIIDDVVNITNDTYKNAHFKVTMTLGNVVKMKIATFKTNRIGKGKFYWDGYMWNKKNIIKIAKGIEKTLIPNNTVIMINHIFNNEVLVDMKKDT